MDVNGYVFKVKVALLNENPEMKGKLYLVKSVTLGAIQKSFSTHSSWDDLKDEESAFVKFLKATCSAGQPKAVRESSKTSIDVKVEDELQKSSTGGLTPASPAAPSGVAGGASGAEEENGPKSPPLSDVILLDPFKLRILGILMCYGDPDEKAEEMFQIINDNGVSSMTCNDKDLGPTLKALWEAATITAFEQEAAVLGGQNEITEKQIADAREKYDELVDDWLDEVYGVENKLERDEWVDIVSTKEEASWIFDQNSIRQRLGYIV